MESINTKGYNRSLVDELIEYSDKDKKIIKSFYSRDNLSTDIFEVNGSDVKMIPDVKNKLLKISDAFIEYIGFTFFIYDVILTGSLSNYNFSEYSDVDLHIVVDFNEFVGNNGDNPIMNNIIKEFLKSKKGNWNSLHKVKIKSYDVELYVQDIHEKHLSSGVYSVLNDKWIINPGKNKNNIDEKLILDKGEEYAKTIDKLVEMSEQGKDVTKDIDEIRRKLKKFRQSGLESGGEYSYENLVFKLLRRDGYIEKLLKLKNDVMDKQLSLYEN